MSDGSKARPSLLLGVTSALTGALPIPDRSGPLALNFPYPEGASIRFTQDQGQGPLSTGGPSFFLLLLRRRYIYCGLGRSQPVAAR